MSKTIQSLILLAAIVLLSSGCNEKPGPKVLARVNGTPLTAQDVEYRLVLDHARQPQYGPKNIEDIIDQELLSQKGMSLGLDRDPGYKNQLAKLNQQPPGAKRLEMARRVFNTQIAARVEVTPREARDYYERHQEQIGTDLKIGFIKTSDKHKAQEALARLRAGADFGSVAGPIMGSAPGPDGRLPWDLGFVRWDQVPIDFVDVIYRLKPGQTSEVLGNHATGYQIVRVEASRPARTSGYAAVAAAVTNRLRDLKLLEAYRSYLAALRKEAKIVTF